MKVYTLEQIKASFLADDLEQWKAPDLTAVHWQEIDFLSWKHPQDGHYFACIESDEDLIGIVVRMNSGIGSGRNACALCGASNHAMGVKACFVETRNNPRKKIGTHICADLGCSARVRGQSAGLFSYETISTGRRIERLQERLQRFIRRSFDS